MKNKIERLRGRLDDVKLQIKKISNINKDKLIMNERRLVTAEKRVKKLTLDITNKMVEREDMNFELPRQKMIQKIYEFDEICENLKEEYLRLETNLELAQDRNIELKLKIDKKIQKILNKKSRILRVESVLNGKLLEYEYLKNELGINEEELSEDEDIFDDPYYASRKREKKMRKEIA